MKLYHLEQGRLIVSDLEVAGDRKSRNRGLIGHAPLQMGQGLLIRPSGWIHTFGMSFPIDVIYLDAQGRIVALSENMAPGKADRPVLRARAVLEMAAGAVRHFGLAKGQRLELRP